MGRAMQSVGRPPAGSLRNARAKKAKATINQVIPTLLSAHPRARRGIEASELIVDPPPFIQPRTDSGDTDSDDAQSCGHRLTLQVADTLTAAQRLLFNGDSVPDSSAKTPRDPPTRVAILNMASPLSPGGGFFNGAKSQEESLCMRTTLLPSLKDEYYRLPEVGAIYTPDVLVFRNEAADEVLSKSGRWFVDCISAAMLRQPDTERDAVTGRGSYVHQKDRDMAMRKMRMVMRICQAKGTRKVVLGAWGCGAYGNPLGEIAAAWRKVLVPKRNGRPNKHKSGRPKGHLETWNRIEEVVFAINDPGMAEAFGAAFGEELVWDEAMETHPDETSSEAASSDEI